MKSLADYSIIVLIICNQVSYIIFESKKKYEFFVVDLPIFFFSNIFVTILYYTKLKIYF